MAAARKPASRRSKPRPRARARPRARRSALASLRVPVLEQRHLDLLGLGLVALGVFLAFPLYLSWDGGRWGRRPPTACAISSAQVSYAVPVAVAASGAILVLRPVLPAVRPFRSGALCLFAALTLALAAGTFGLGPEGDAPTTSRAATSRTAAGSRGTRCSTPRQRRLARSARTSSPCSSSAPPSCC